MPPASSLPGDLGSKQQHVPTAASLRRLLREMIPDDVDLDELCADYLREARAEFTVGMQRTTKLTILLEKAPHPRIIAALQEWRPDAFAAHEHLLKYTVAAGSTGVGAGGPTPQYADERMRGLGARLAELHHEEGELRAASGDPARIREVIEEQLRVRREMRAGPSLRVGEWLDGRYQILEKLGRGGFATVWKAFDQRLRRLVAVKVLLGEWYGDRSRVERFERGARLMEGLTHPAIVRILAPPTDNSEFHYFVMSYVDDGDLYRAVLRKTIDRSAALDAILQAGDALQFAHEHDITHRDVKPQNILLDTSGRAQVTDFDLAAAADTTGGTRTSAMGTFLWFFRLRNG